MDFTKALTYPFDDKDWLKKLAFLLIGIIPILGTICVEGWAVDTTRRVRAREALPLGSWDDFGAVFSRGIPVFLARIVYGIPVFIFMCIGFAGSGILTGAGLGAAAGSNSDAGAQAGGALASLGSLLVPCCACLAVLVGIAGAVVYLGGYIRFLDKPEFGTFMQFSDNLALVQANGGDFGMAILYVIGAGAIAGLVSGTGIGALLAVPFITYFSAHVFGQLAIKLSGASAAPQV